MKKLVGIFLAMAILCWGGNALARDYVFQSTSEAHKKGYTHSASLACKSGVFTPFIRGYSNNPDPVGVVEIQDYVNNLKGHPAVGTSCTEGAEPLEWKGFNISPPFERRAGEKTVFAQKSPADDEPRIVLTSVEGQPWGEVPTEDWYRERSSQIQVQRSEQSSTVTIRGDKRRIAMLKGIIPPYWQGISNFQTTHDTSLGNRVVVTGNGGTETIIFTEKTVSRLERMSTNPASGDSLMSICPTQASQLGRALGRPALATYTAKVSDCPSGNCEHAKMKHLKACTQPLDWRTTANGTPVAYVVCELKGGKREGQVSAAWRFDPKKQGAGPDGWYLGFVRYSQWQPTGGADWQVVPQAAWAHIENISRSRPTLTSPPQLYDVCDFQLF